MDRWQEYKRRFWARRPDGIVVDKEQEICYVLEFKRKMDRWIGYREEATDRSTNQCASLMHGLKNASRWTIHLVNIVGGMCGSVRTKTFNVCKWDAVRRQRLFKLMEEQDGVLGSFFAKQKGVIKSRRPTGHVGEAEHLGRDVYAFNGTGYSH